MDGNLEFSHTGTEFEFTDSESDIKIRKFPSLLHGKRSAPELPLLPPASVMREDSSPGKRGRKPKSQTKLSLSFSAEGSDEERWIRRRSERIFLHDAAQAKPSSPSKTALPKPVRGPKAPLHGSKDIPKPREVKTLGKVGAGLLMHAKFTAEQQCCECLVIGHEKTTETCQATITSHHCPSLCVLPHPFNSALSGVTH